MSAAPRLTTRNAPCLRYVLVRVVQCTRHLSEVAEGVAAAHAPARAHTAAVTERGRAQAGTVGAGLVSFARGLAWEADSGAGASAQASVSREWMCFTDGGAESYATLAALGATPAFGSETALPSASVYERAAIESSIVRSAMNLNVIQPVLVVASSTTISALVGEITGARAQLGLACGSVTMLDVFEDGRCFVHCIGDTALVAAHGVHWWRNAP